MQNATLWNVFPSEYSIDNTWKLENDKSNLRHFESCTSKKGSYASNIIIKSIFNPYHVTGLILNPVATQQNDFLRFLGDIEKDQWHEIRSSLRKRCSEGVQKI